MRVLKGRTINLTHTFLDDDEPMILTDVAVTLNDSQGEEVATATASKDAEEVWSASFSMQPLGVYTAVWNGVTAVDETDVEVVNNFLFTVPQARNSDEYLEDVTAFPTEEIKDYRETVEQEFQRIAGRSFTTRVKDRTFTTDGTREFVALVPDAQAIEGVWLDGVAVADISEWEVSTLGKVTAPEVISAGSRLRVRYRYGFTTPPADVARVGMVRLRDLMASETSGIPDRATTFQPENGGTYRLATPGVGRWKTGIPEVDSTLQSYTLDTVLSVYAGG